MLEQLKEQWDNILLHVKEEHDIMDVSFNTWLLPLKIFAVDGNVVKILAPDAQMLRYIQKKYGLILQVSIEEVTGFACTLDFITEDDVKIQPLHSVKYLFTTKTCPNCAMAKEILKDQEYVVIDAEENVELTQQYGVMQAPTLVVVDGEHTKKYVNASNIQKFVDETLVQQ